MGFNECKFLLQNIQALLPSLLIDENKLGKFEEYMHKSEEFLNPNYDVLFEINGLDVNETYSFMSSLKNGFPRDIYAKELRRAQASKWAFRSVAEGIEYFKNGNHVEAFQCLNKALTIDPRNVEGLVARGALYANKGSFLKAVEDFDKALKLNAYHGNARKYMGETLVALGRRYEEENFMKDAAKAYQDCLNITPNHEQARLLLEAIQQRAVNVSYTENAVNLSAAEHESDKIHGKEASSGEESTSSGSGSESEHSDYEETFKEGSLSPLSKRMALHVASLKKEEESRKQLNQPFYMTAYNVPPDPVPIAARTINDFRLDDDDTGSRVRKLLQEASKHKKEKKKTKKKKNKKSKKDTRKEKVLGSINFQEAYKAISSVNIENKLTENLQKYEKTIAQIKKRQQELVQSIEAGMTERSKRSESPPPRAPSMRLQPNKLPPIMNYGSTSESVAYAIYPSTSTTPTTATAISPSCPKTTLNEASKLSFQIKRAAKVDKMGLLRLATPLIERSLSPRSRSRSNDHSRRGHSRSRYRSRSDSLDRHGGRRSRSRSFTRGGRWRRSRSRYTSRSRSPYRRSRSRTRSRSHRSRSRSGRGRRESPLPRRHAGGGGGARRDPHRGISRDIIPSPPSLRQRGGKQKATRAGRGGGIFGNRVWRRTKTGEGQDSNGRWLHDKYDECMQINKVDDGPSIEEIDEIINRAQQQRKIEIIQRDKDILKKPSAGKF